MDKRAIQQPIVVDESQQDELWKEVGEFAGDIAWGTHWWEFADECKKEYYLVRKPAIEPDPS